jgi:hypothetical protein
VVAVGRDDNVDGGSTAAVTSGSANAAPAPVPAGGTP